MLRPQSKSRPGQDSMFGKQDGRRGKERTDAQETARRTRQAERAERKDREKSDPAMIKARAKARELRRGYKARLHWFQAELVGKNRRFPGKIVLPTPEDAEYSDLPSLRTTDEKLDKTALYWVDATLYHHNLGTQLTTECMGAGVVWREKHANLQRWDWRSNEFPLGRNTGSCGDAELYAISAALGLALQEVESGKRKIQTVRIFTDHLGLLQAIPVGHLPLGPFISTRLAIQDLYDRADWLVERDIHLELIWVRGHSKSVGNKMAHKAGARAAQAQAILDKNAEQYKLNTLKTQAPAMFEAAGEVWKEEWLWRANQNLLVRKGRAIELDAEPSASKRMEQYQAKNQQVSLAPGQDE